MMTHEIEWNTDILEKWCLEAIDLAHSKGLGGKCYPDKQLGTTYLTVLMSNSDMRKIMEHVKCEFRDKMYRSIDAGKPFKMSFKEYKARVLELAVDPEWWRE